MNTDIPKVLGMYRRVAIAQRDLSKVYTPKQLRDVHGPQSAGPQPTAAGEPRMAGSEADRSNLGSIGGRQRTHPRQSLEDEYEDQHPTPRMNMAYELSNRRRRSPGQRQDSVNKVWGPAAWEASKAAREAKAVEHDKQAAIHRSLTDKPTNSSPYHRQAMQAHEEAARVYRSLNWSRTKPEQRSNYAWWMTEQTKKMDLKKRIAKLRNVINRQWTQDMLDDDTPNNQSNPAKPLEPHAQPHTHNYGQSKHVQRSHTDHDLTNHGMTDGEGIDHRGESFEHNRIDNLRKPTPEYGRRKNV